MRVRGLERVQSEHATPKCFARPVLDIMFVVKAGPISGFGHDSFKSARNGLCNDETGALALTRA